MALLSSPVLWQWILEAIRERLLGFQQESGKGPDDECKVAMIGFLVSLLWECRGRFEGGIKATPKFFVLF